MHDGEIQVVGCIELLSTVDQFVEPGSESVQILEVVVGFDSRVHDFLLQFGEGVGVGALVPFEESQNVLHFVRFQLFVN